MPLDQESAGVRPDGVHEARPGQARPYVRDSAVPRGDGELSGDAVLSICTGILLVLIAAAVIVFDALSRL